MTQASTSLYSCNSHTVYLISLSNYFFVGECLVNSKIPLSLFTKLESRLRRYLQTKLDPSVSASNSNNPNNTTIVSDQLDILAGDEVLAATIESLQITEDPQVDAGNQEDGVEHDNSNPDSLEPGHKRNIKVFLYKYPETSSDDPTTNPRSIDTAQHDPSADSFYTLETFPTAAYQGLWESLEFDSAVKSSILAYITAIFKFSLLGLTERNEISFNRILLLHGPPGTGI